MKSGNISGWFQRSGRIVGLWYVCPCLSLGLALKNIVICPFCGSAVYEVVVH